MVVYKTKQNVLSPISTEDMSILELQLGRRPIGVMAIKSRCRFGCPQVIQNEVFRRDKPFPTLFWLTCPLKVKMVAQIEGQGWSDYIKKRIETDMHLKEHLLQAHDSYRRHRFEALKDLKYKNHRVFKTGIGGVRDVEGIKCLHAHYAHYLAIGRNPLGEMIDKLVQIEECNKRCYVL